MTQVLDPPALDEKPPPPPDAAAPAPPGSPPPVPEAPGDAARRALSAAQRRLLALSALSTTASAGWMTGGLFRDAFTARALAMLGAVIGVGLAWLSYRTTRPATVQYLILPAAALVGAVLMAPYAPGGSATLPNLVVEAVRGGGLLQPPVPFDPGWRFILVLVMAALGGGALCNAVGLRRSRLAVAIPVPLVFAAALVQPPHAELLGSTVGLCLLVVGLTFGYGADLAAEARLSGAFELRRLGRAGALLTVVMIGMVLLSNTGFLFPTSQRTNILPARKPVTTTQVEPDRELFRVSGTLKGPWRLGVEDVYDGSGWLLPPIDPRQSVPLPGSISPEASTTTTVTVRLSDMGGRLVPMAPLTSHLAGLPADTTLNTRTGVAETAALILPGLGFTVVADPLPSGQQLAGVPAPPASMAQFLAVPPPPTAIRDLLDKAPTDGFDRLQALRSRLYQTVVAAGAGNPVDVTPARVVQMLKPDTEASPYEITAAEAILARWAGVPSRIGFGYYGGDSSGGGLSVHPRHGAAWLEAYFQGYGWVPLLGTPPRARASLGGGVKNNDSTVRPSDQLAISVFVPVLHPQSLLLFEVIRYYLGIALAVAAVLGALYAGYGPLLKRVRRRRRARWAHRHGPAARAYVAYAELRDLCIDLNVGDPRHTPLEFLASVDDDEEHRELAWLVTRLLWGDLRRLPTGSLAVAAEHTARSVRARLMEAQQPFNRGVAWLSRASLRDPYVDDLPNVWPRSRLRGRLPSLRLGGLRGAVRRGHWRRRAVPQAAAVGGVLLSLLLSGCSATEQAGLTGSKVPATLPEHIVPSAPDTLLGYGFVRQAALEGEYRKVTDDTALVNGGRVYTVERNHVVQGTVQVAVFKPNVDAGDAGVRAQVESSFGGTFITDRVGIFRVRRLERSDLRIFVWFPPERDVMVTMAFRTTFTDTDRLVHALLYWEHGMPSEGTQLGAVVETRPGATPAATSSASPSPSEAAPSPAPSPSEAAP